MFHIVIQHWFAFLFSAMSDIEEEYEWVNNCQIFHCKCVKFDYNASSSLHHVSREQAEGRLPFCLATVKSYDHVHLELFPSEEEQEEEEPEQEEEEEYGGGGFEGIVCSWPQNETDVRSLMAKMPSAAVASWLCALT